MSKIPIVIFLIVVILAGSIYISFRSDRNIVDLFAGENSESETANVGGGQEGTSDIQNGNGGSSGGGGSSASSSGAGGAGESSSSGSQTIGEDCRMQQISYSLKNFGKTQECISYAGEECLMKTITCSLEVNNLDYEISGSFAVKFDFFADGAILESVTDTKMVEPRAAEIFLADYQVQGENANKELTCSFSTEEVPEREVCGAPASSPASEE